MTELDATTSQSSLSSRELAIGSVFAGRFEIISILGHGGTAIVYKVRQMPIDRIVALKVLHPWLLTKESSQQRFQLEAKALCGLNHPNILKIYSYGLENETCFLAMDYLKGQTIAELQANSGIIAPDKAVKMVIDVAEALTAAHASGIIHRDIKPSNIMLVDVDGTQVVKILDFGLAKILNEESSQKLTATDHVIGTPHYMSPEQCAQQPLDCRSDIYSLGCVLQEMITGKSPFAGTTAFAVMYEHLNGTPEPLPAEIPKWLQATIQLMLKRDPAERFQSMAEVAAALRRQSAPHLVPSSAQRTKQKAAANARIVTASLCLTGALALAGTLWMYFSTTRPPTAATSNKDFEDKLTNARTEVVNWSMSRARNPVSASVNHHGQVDRLYGEAIALAEKSPTLASRVAEIEWEASDNLGRFGKTFALKAIHSELNSPASSLNTAPTEQMALERLEETQGRFLTLLRNFQTQLMPDETCPLGSEIYKRLTVKYLRLKRLPKARQACLNWRKVAKEKGGANERAAIQQLFMLPDNSPEQRRMYANELFEAIMNERSGEQAVQKTLIEQACQLAGYFVTVDPPKAAKCQIRAVSLTKLANGANSLASAVVYKQLADHYFETSQRQLAAPLYEKALGILQQTQEKETTAAEELHCLNYLIMLAQIRGDTTATKRYLKMAIEVATDSSLETAPNSVERYINEYEIQLADTLIIEHKFDEAKKYLDRLLPQLERIAYGQAVLSKALNSQANLLEATGDKTYKSFRLKAYHYQKSLKEQSQEAAWTCGKLADLSEKEKDLEAAVKYQEEMLSLVKQLPAHHSSLPIHQARLENLRTALRAQKSP